MDYESLKKKFEEFKKGEVIISIHEDYEDVFLEYLEVNNITKFWVEKKRVYLNYRTSTLAISELRNSEMRKVKKMIKKKKLRILKEKKKQIEKEILEINN